MRVVAPKRLTDFALNHSLSRIPLLNWYEIVRKAKWEPYMI